MCGRGRLLAVYWPPDAAIGRLLATHSRHYQPLFYAVDIHGMKHAAIPSLKDLTGTCAELPSLKSVNILPGK